MEFGQKVIVGLLLMLLIAGCGTGNTVVEPEVEEHTEENEEEVVPAPEVVPSEDATVFVVTGENFKFVMDGKDNPDITVKQGDTVRIEFESTSGFHDWVVDEFSAATAKVRPGNATAVEFVADKKGTFEYYCSVGSHRANGMKGNLIVE